MNLGGLTSDPNPSHQNNVPFGGIFSLLVLIHQKLTSDPAIQQALDQAKKEIAPEIARLKKKMSAVVASKQQHASHYRRTPSAPGLVASTLQYVQRARQKLQDFSSSDEEDAEDADSDEEP